MNKEQIRKIQSDYLNACESEHDMELIFDLALQAIPSAELKTGHWILGICDNCGYDWSKDAPIASVPNFCPNCGAKMIEPQHQKMGCEGCIHEKTGNNSTYPCSHCSRCYTDKYKAESEGNEKNKKRFENELIMMQTNIFPYKGEQE